jgi:zinc protease
MSNVAFASLFIAVSPVATAAESKPLFPYPMVSTTLPNGLSVTRVPFKSPGLVAFYTVVRVGSRNEVETGHTGFAHFFEHVMFKGTKNWPEGTRDALLGKLGFSENAFTSDEVGLYHVNGPTSSLEKLIELEADRFMNLEYSEATFQTEAKAVLGEYHKNAANPGLKLEEALAATAFTRHPYQHTTLGFYDDITVMPTRYAYSKEFFKRWYTPDNVYLFIVGEFDDDAVLKAVEKFYGPWAGKAAGVAIPPEPAQTEARSTTVTWTTPTLPRHGLYWHTPAASLKDKFGPIQEVLGAYLAGSTSPLFKSLVLEKQLCESVGPDYFMHRDPQLFGLSAKLKDEKHRLAVQTAMLTAVAEVAKGKIDAARLSAIKDNVKYGLLMSVETQSNVALQLAYTAGILGAPQALGSYYAMIDKVTATDLGEFARAHLIEAQRTTLVFNVQVADGKKAP